MIDSWRKLLMKQELAHKDTGTQELKILNLHGRFKYIPQREGWSLGYVMHTLIGV